MKYDLKVVLLLFEKTQLMLKTEPVGRRTFCFHAFICSVLVTASNLGSSSVPELLLANTQFNYFTEIDKFSYFIYPSES